MHRMRSIVSLILIAFSYGSFSEEQITRLPFEYIVVSDKNDSISVTGFSRNLEPPFTPQSQVGFCGGVIRKNVSQIEEFFSRPHQTWDFQTTYETWTPIDGVIQKHNVWSVE